MVFGVPSFKRHRLDLVTLLVCSRPTIASALQDHERIISNDRKTSRPKPGTNDIHLEDDAAKAKESTVAVLIVSFLIEARFGVL